MADPVLDKSKFNLLYFFQGDGAKDWWKALGTGFRLAAICVLGLGVILVCMNVWSFFKPKPAQNTYNPRNIVLPGARVDKIDQTSTQILVEEKPWEIGCGAGVFSYDSKPGGIAWGWAKRKF